MRLISRFREKDLKMESKVAYKILLLSIVLILFGGLFSVLNIFGELTPVDSIEIFSENVDYSKKEAGSWKVTKSARWNGRGTAEITFNIDTVAMLEKEYTDVLFVLDVSGSMYGDKLNRVKNDSVELVESLLSNNKNRAALITFETGSKIVLELTNDKEQLINGIQNLTTGGVTNYYQALVNVDKILKNYVREDDRETIVLFLTDGYPNENTPNEVGFYKYLKSVYPFVTFNAVQYEMGKSILEPITRVSDNQYLADMETLNNVLFEASVKSLSYENFQVSDFIDTRYFYVDSDKDIKTNIGDVTFDKSSQSVFWNIENLKSGSKAKLTIKVRLKTELIGKGGIYPTNEHEKVVSKIAEVEENVSSKETPIVSDNYKVVYDVNAPNGCSVEGLPSEEAYSVYDTVGISEIKPECSGYLFKGWDVITKDVKKINDDYFIMPEEDVIVRAKWSNVRLTKKMDGTISEAWTLYKQVEKDASTSGKYVKKYTGATDTFNGNREIYYYYGNATNNNVIFAEEYCWKIVRTTDTGGVKLVYNGIASNGTCNNTGTAAQLAKWQLPTGTASYNIPFNNESTALSDVGYMFDSNSRYVSSSRGSGSILAGYKFGNSFVYNDGSYTLENTKDISSWSSDYKSLSNNHYTCFNDTGVCSEVYYVHYTTSSSAYYITLSNGESVDDALNKMVNGDVNKNDSNLKYSIEDWYSRKMTGYTHYLEDTVWCNDRSIANYGGWNPNGGITLSALSFKNSSSDLTCSNSNDRFTVSEVNGNGKAKYPIGFLTSAEMNLAGAGSYLKTGSDFWSMSPYSFSISAENRYVRSTGSYSNDAVSNIYGVRPAISLKSGIEYMSGDGSTNSPYVIDMGVKNMITMEERDDVYLSDQASWEGKVVYIFTHDTEREVTSFKMNGREITGNNFVMPDVSVSISDIKIGSSRILESNHPYEDTDMVKERTFENAKYLNIIMNFKLGSSKEYINIYDKTGKVYTYYSKGQGQFIRIDLVIPGDYVKLEVHEESDNNVVYGYKGNIIPYYGDLHNIRISGSDKVTTLYSNAVKGMLVKLESEQGYFVDSFKMNGVYVSGDLFEMPDSDVVVSDIVLRNGIIFESEHNPYSPSLNDIKEYTFEGATSLTVELDYQTEGINYDWIYLYDSNNNVYGKYGGKTRKTETITIPGNYIKVQFYTSFRDGDYYGYKAKMTPNY